MWMSGPDDQKSHANQAAQTTTTWVTAAEAVGGAHHRGDNPTGETPTGDNPDELFDLVDEHDHVIGRVRRADAHRNPALLHRSVQVLVFNDEGQVLLQRRSATKDTFPGYYCASASGHLAVGEDYASAAAREVREELGISLALAERGRGVLRGAQETELTAVFTARSNGPFTFHPTETDGGAFFVLAALDQGRDTHTLPMTPALLAALDLIRRQASGGVQGVDGSGLTQAGSRQPVDPS